MKRFIIISTLALCSYVGITNSSAHSIPFTGGSIEPTVLRIDLNHNKPHPITKKHIRAEKMLSAVLLGECRGQGKSCMLAVGHVAMNRAKLHLDVRYGKGLSGVIGKRKAFSCFLKNDPNKKVIDKALAGELNPNTPDGEAWTLAKEVAHTLMHRLTTDPTHGATHYRATYIQAAWETDNGMKRIARISGHVFFRKEG